MATAYLVAGLGYGDEGKGATVDFLARDLGARLVVRYNGGAQAGHNVVTPNGNHHTFSQFGSGMFVPGVWTYLSKYMMVNPLNMMLEEEALRSLGVRNAFKRTLVDKRSLITTPFQSAVNKVLLKVSGKNNSCGMGIGQTREDHIKYGDAVVFAGDIRSKDPHLLKMKLRLLQSVSFEKVRKYLNNVYIQETFPGILDLFLSTKSVDDLASDYDEWPVGIVGNAMEAFDILDLTGTPRKNVIFEGAQGVLLDEEFGEEGFNTWTKTTFHNCASILDEAIWQGSSLRIGVLRTYMTRHGDGPLPTKETDWFPSEKHNVSDGAQGKFRKSNFSFEAVDKALKICGGVDIFALNHFDELVNPVIVEGLEKRAPVSIVGMGPTADDRRWTQNPDVDIKNGGIAWTAKS